MSEYKEARNELEQKQKKLQGLLMDIEQNIDVIALEEKRVYGKQYAISMKELRLERLEADIHPLIYALKEIEYKRMFNIKN
jgi:hypothetical protein